MTTLKNELIKNVICAMAADLESEQLKKLENTLLIQLRNVSVQEECTEISTKLDDNEYVMRQFIASKKLEGNSLKSIEQYVRTTRTMLQTLDKNFKDITTNDVKFYLAMYQQQKNIKQNTLANTKRFISAFFAWCEDEELIVKNPVRAIKNIRQEQKEKQYLTDDEIERMRDYCDETREKAIFEFLLSTGCRVSEVVSLNRSDVNLEAGTVRIYASKTRTYRTGYLTAKANLCLKKYFLTRNDNNEALFVTSRKPNNRLGAGSLQDEMQSIALKAKIDKHVTVHLFRKTLATKLCRQGVDVTIIKELLGHANINVTAKNYISIDQDIIKAAHRRCA